MRPKRNPFASMLCVLALVPFAAGCGGDDDKSVDKRRPAPAPAESLDQALGGLTRAAGARDCAAVDAIVPSQRRLNPGQPLTPPECRTLRRRFKDLAGFKVTAKRRYGTGAVADLRVGPAVQTAVFALDSDRRWKVVDVVNALPQVALTNPNRGRFDSAAAQFVDSVRDGDCTKLFAAVATSARVSREASGSKTRICRVLLAGPDDPATLRGALGRDDGAKPRRLGVTRDFGFYSLATETGRYDTVILVTQPRDAPKSALRGKLKVGLFDVLSARSAR